MLEDLDDPPGGAMWGEWNANVHRALGCVGTITQGAVRDLDALERLGFHAFATSVSAAHGYGAFVGYGEPVTVAGLRVETGDLLVADLHGVLRIPPEIPIAELVEAGPRDRPARVGDLRGVSVGRLQRRTVGEGRGVGARAVAEGPAGRHTLRGMAAVTEPLRCDTDDRVRVITLTRADEYNTINPALRDALGDALDDADHDRGVHAVLLRADGPAFCAGYQLDWATSGQAEARVVGRPGVGLRRRPAGDRSVRVDVGEAAHDLEADDRRGAGLVHRGRHQHGAERRPDRVQRVGAVRLPADARVGDSRGAVGVDRAARPRARQAVPVHG